MQLLICLLYVNTTKPFWVFSFSVTILFQWIGMGNQELLDYFSSYSAVRARHSYGPKGHRGMSLLIFEASAVGYAEAERLSKHFEDQGTDREAWDRRRVIFYPGGQRQLYGFMAEKGDLDIFNQHSQGTHPLSLLLPLLIWKVCRINAFVSDCLGKSKMKFEMRSYQEMVVSQLKQMSEDNQQLILFKDKVAKEQMYSKNLEQSYGWATERLRRVSEENRIVRQRTKIHHEQNKEEVIPKLLMNSSIKMMLGGFVSDMEITNGYV